MKLLLLLLALIVNAFCIHADDPATSRCLTITRENMSMLMEDEWMVEFYAPWCPACTSFSNTWELFAESVDIKVAKVNVVEETELGSRFLVTSLPTIFHIIDGKIRYYNMQQRELKVLMKFIEKKQWEMIKPLPWYMSPFSHVMTVFSYIIRLFMGIEHIFKSVSEQFQIDPFFLAGGFILLSLIAGFCCGGLLYFWLGFYKVNNYVPKKARQLAENEKENKDKDTVSKKEE